MKGVRFTQAEQAFLRSAITTYCSPWGDQTKATQKVAASVVAKLDKANEPKEPGANVGPIQDAMVAAAMGKVIKLEGGFPVASRRCADMKVTPDDARLVGEWMYRQGWLTGPMTLLDVLNKWYQWLPKARATQPPPALQAGLGTNGTGPGPAAAGPTAKVGRTPQGFR